MKITSKKIYSTLVLMLIAVFAVMAIALTTLGINLYSKITAISDTNYYHRTALSYMVNQIRRGDHQNCISVGKFGESDAIFISESINNASYTTILYAYDGYLNELYTQDGIELTPKDGVQVMMLDNLNIEVKENLITIIGNKDSDTFITSITPRTGVIVRE